METIISIAAVMFAYLLGSVPSAVWVGKYFYGIDIREYGSGNAGATNVFRVLGWKAGVPVLLYDISKGWFAVNIPYILGIYDVGSNEYIHLQLALGTAALLGHIFPVFAGFRGGKGVSTLLGIGFSVHHPSTLVCVGIFVVFFLVTNYVSLSSMLAGVAFPFVLVIGFHNTVSSLHWFALSVAVLVLITHQKNIERLLKGEESKARLFRRK